MVVILRIRVEVRHPPTALDFETRLQLNSNPRHSMDELDPGKLQQAGKHGRDRSVTLSLFSDTLVLRGPASPSCYDDG